MKYYFIIFTLIFYSSCTFDVDLNDSTNVLIKNESSFDISVSMYSDESRQLLETTLLIPKNKSKILKNVTTDKVVYIFTTVIDIIADVTVINGFDTWYVLDYYNTSGKVFFINNSDVGVTFWITSGYPSCSTFYLPSKSVKKIEWIGGSYSYQTDGETDSVIQFRGFGIVFFGKQY